MVKRPLGRTLVATLFTAAVVSASATPALATVTDPPPHHGGGGIPPVTTGPSSPEGGSTYGHAGNCSVVSSSSYLGLSCGDGSITTESVKQILGKDPVPGCWDDKLTDAELHAMSLQASDDGTVWYWERCLKGIDKETKKVGPNGVSFTVGLVGKKPRDEILTLTHNQQQLVHMYAKDGTIPAPIAGVSPSARPRVGSWVSFFDGTGDEVTVQAGTVTLRAHITSIKVEPLGKGKDPLLPCRRTGYKAAHGETQADHPQGCWYRYKASSADQPGNAYPVNITAHWAVDVSTGGGFTRFNDFDKSQVTNIPVTEIEALVVP